MNQFHNYLIEYKTRMIVLAYTPVISATGGRFPRARPQLAKKSLRSFS